MGILNKISIKIWIALLTAGCRENKNLDYEPTTHHHTETSGATASSDVTLVSLRDYMFNSHSRSCTHCFLLLYMVLKN